jgi:hypothetical protein
MIKGLEMVKSDLELRKTWRLTACSAGDITVRTLPALERFDGEESKVLKAGLQGSRAETLRDKAFSKPPLEGAAKLRPGNGGRPSGNTAALTGLLIIKEIKNLTDKEASEAMSPRCSARLPLRLFNGKNAG